MSSLRERQKKARSEQILAAARKQFLDHGYSKTNMETIAEEAEVGVATIYTYFDSKEGVVKALIEKDFNELSIEAQVAIDPPAQDAAKAVINLLKIYRRFDEYISYEMMHDFVSQARTKGPVRDVVDWLYDSQVKHVEQVLKQSQKAGTISGSLDTNIAAGIVIDLFVRHINRITNEARVSKDSKEFYKRIRVLFDNWHA